MRPYYDTRMRILRSAQNDSTRAQHNGGRRVTKHYNEFKPNSSGITWY